ncbi:FAD-binding oxidoreductase [Aquincola sp. MAHUQ-54]|uniref:FAD-binding oxidoreductase n=1 Tax=Aquincola agrisoli TaxID=3119538 RepID=A0AAW9QQR5_9BURK
MSQPLAQGLRAQRAPAWLEPLAGLLGEGHLLTSAADLWAYARDRLPYATFHVRDGDLPGTLPTAVACPGGIEELQAVVRLARAQGVPLIPFGAGSGVLGGTVPLDHELMVDLKRLNRVIELNETDASVTVQAGMNGGQFEAWLNDRGYTCGHLPQSLYMSTVGGWAACRGAGQNSTRFGKIEDIVLGLAAVLPDGRELRVRPVARRAVGPSVKDLLVGSEGSFGIITELTLRVWRLPEARHGVVLGFPSLQAGLDALRTVMQRELRPAVVRLYDAEESAQRGKEAGIGAALPILAILEFCGLPRLAALERDLALEIVAGEGGVVLADGPYRHWMQHRYESYSPQWQSRDHFMDTIEVTGGWSQLPQMYERIRDGLRALSPGMYFGTHWSHVYPEGACQYMTLRLPPMARDEALRLHRQAWDVAQRVCLSLGGSISHHHGVGVFRNPWLKEELGVGLELLQGLKDHLDPANLFVPGKLALRGRAGAVDIAAAGGTTGEHAS